MDIGSEDCPFTAPARILLSGKNLLLFFYIYLHLVYVDMYVHLYVHNHRIQ